MENALSPGSNYFASIITHTPGGSPLIPMVASVLELGTGTQYGVGTEPLGGIFLSPSAHMFWSNKNQGVDNPH